MTLSVCQLVRPSMLPTGSGGWAVVGASTTSYRRKIAPTWMLKGFSSARATRSSGPPKMRAIPAFSRVRESSSSGSGTRPTQSRNATVERGTMLVPTSP